MSCYMCLHPQPSLMFSTNNVELSALTLTIKSAERRWRLSWLHVACVEVRVELKQNKCLVGRLELQNGCHRVEPTCRTQNETNNHLRQSNSFRTSGKNPHCFDLTLFSVLFSYCFSRASKWLMVVRKSLLTTTHQTESVTYSDVC